MLTQMRLNHGLIGLYHKGVIAAASKKRGTLERMKDAAAVLMRQKKSRVGKTLDILPEKFFLCGGNCPGILSWI